MQVMLTAQLKVTFELTNESQFVIKLIPSDDDIQLHVVFQIFGEMAQELRLIRGHILGRSISFITCQYCGQKKSSSLSENNIILAKKDSQKIPK